MIHGLYSPWNSPGQNTGVGSLSFLQGIFPTQGLNPGLLHGRWILYQLSHKKVKVLVTRSCPALWSHGLQPTRLICPLDFLGKDTGVGSHFLLQGIFPTQRSNPGLLHCRQILYWLSNWEAPKQIAGGNSLCDTVGSTCARWQPGEVWCSGRWERGSRGTGYMSTYGWFMLMAETNTTF